jgi:HSP20 family protein
LPESVDPNKAKCTFKKGMLWIELPKKGEAVESHRELKIESVEKQTPEALVEQHKT